MVLLSEEYISSADNSSILQLEEDPLLQVELSI